MFEQSAQKQLNHRAAESPARSTERPEFWCERPRSGGARGGLGERGEERKEKEGREQGDAWEKAAAKAAWHVKRGEKNYRVSPPAASPLSVFPDRKSCGATRRRSGSRRASERRPHRAISPADLSAGDSGTGARGSLSPRRSAAVSHGLGAAAWLGLEMRLGFGLGLGLGLGLGPGLELGLGLYRVRAI